MLDEYKKLNREYASAFPDWNHININDLIRSYSKDSPLAESCLAAIIYREWNIPSSAYNKQEVKGLTEEDIYEIYLDSIIQVLNEQPWNNPNSSIYQDPKGPEKALKVAFKCRRINAVVALERQKRKTSYMATSIDKIEEDGNIIPSTQINDKPTSLELFIKKIVLEYINKEDYSRAILLDIIFNHIFDVKKVTDSFIIKTIRNIDEDYCIYFSTNYSIDIDTIKDFIYNIKREEDNVILKVMRRRLRRIQKDTRLINYLQR